MDTVLEARGLVKDYRRARAVDGVDLVLRAGERVALLGPNGAGKTTTLLMLLGVVSPDAGTVVISGHRLERERSRAAENVGIVRATLHRPRLLVLDEPTASLDPDVALRVRTGLRELCEEEGTALLVTTHDMAEVSRLCERVVFLSQGRIVADGTPEEVSARYGRSDLEGVFLHLADERLPEPEPPGAQQTDRPL